MERTLVTNPIEWITGPEPSRTRFVCTFISTIVVILVLYETAVTYHSTVRLVLPSLEDIAHELGILVFGTDVEAPSFIVAPQEQEPFLEQLSRSLFRLGIGLVIGSALGFALSVMTSVWPLLRKLTDAYFSVLHSTPWLIWAYMIPAVLGYTYLAAIIVVVQATGFKNISFTFYGTKRELYGSATTNASRQVLIDRMVLSGANRWGLCLHMAVPLALQHLFSALRESARTGISVLIIAEVFLGTALVRSSIKEARLGTPQ